MFTPDELVHTLEFNSAPLTEEERTSIQQFYNGRALQQLVIMPGWEVLLSAFESHKLNATQELLDINPGDKDLVLAAHATAYAVNKTLDNLKYEVLSAIESSKQPPEILARLKQQ